MRVPNRPGRVFSAQAEVFLRICVPPRRLWRFLRASGGVSASMRRFFAASGFSPRKRRCFSDFGERLESLVVFSAQAEVFLPTAWGRFVRSGFLRASGGVSLLCLVVQPPEGFSPRKRRCFLSFLFSWRC